MKNYTIEHMNEYFKKKAEKEKYKYLKDHRGIALMKKYVEHEKWLDENDSHRIGDREKYWDYQKKHNPEYYKRYIENKGEMAESGL